MKRRLHIQTTHVILRISSIMMLFSISTYYRNHCHNFVWLNLLDVYQNFDFYFLFLHTHKLVRDNTLYLIMRIIIEFDETVVALMKSFEKENSKERTF